MDVHVGEVSLDPARRLRRATFRPLATDRALGFEVTVAPDLPETVHTDEQRLQQVLRNLLSNAVKFTEQGTVRLVVEPARRRSSRPHCRAATSSRSRWSTPASASRRRSSR